MKKMIALLLVVVMMLGVFTGCGQKQEAPAPEQAPEAAPEKTPEKAPEVAPETAPEAEGNDKFAGRTLKILMSVGGGGNYYEPVAERMMEDYPGLTIEIDYNNAAGDALRTQILAGTAPDMWNINSGHLPPYEAIGQGIARPIDEILTLPTLDGSKTIGDLVDMNMFNLGLVDGDHYIMHEVMYLSGLWYDENFFEANNLTLPTNWDELLVLAEECEALGMDLFGYAGTLAPEYACNYWWWPMVMSTDWDTFVDLQNLKPEAFKSDAMKRVIEKMETIRNKGYYNTNTMGLGNAETQMSHINHDFLFLPCGSWLEAEMADAWTEDWKVAYMPYSFGDEAGNAYMRCSSLNSMVSATTENWDLVCEFYRYLFSDPEAIYGCTSVHQNTMKVDNFAENCGELLPYSVSDAAGDLENMTGVIIGSNSWYPMINPELGNMINALMSGDIDAETFMQRGYDLIESVKNDDSVAKYQFG